MFTVAVNFPDSTDRNNAQLESFSHVSGHTWGDGKMVSVTQPVRLYIAV